MYTQCPNCDTFFRLTPDQLRAAGGKVRCGVCDTTFNALDSIQDALPQQVPTDTAGQPTRVVAEHKQEARAAKRAERATRKSEKVSRKSVTKQSGGRRVLATMGWFMANLLLIALFPIQFLYFERDMLAAEYPELRPHLVQACEQLGCELSPRRDTDAIEISRRDIRSHPEAEGALLIHAQLINRADFAQPYPELHLVLSDLQDTPVAQRLFTPQDYLDRDHNPSEFMSAGGTAHITLAVQDPGDNAINFRIDLH